MRLKIILPHAIIVLLVGVLSYVVVRQRLLTLDDPATVKAAVEKDSFGAAGVLQLQLLRAERWLAEHGTTEVLRERLQNLGLEDKGRREKTSAALGELKRHATEARSVFSDAPDLTALVDKNGKAVGRSEDPQTYAGDDFAKEYPALLTAIQENRTGSDIWLSSRFSHKHLVSYAPVRDTNGAAIGAVVLAWSLSDQRLSGVTDGAAALVVLEGGAAKVKAKANESMAPGFTNDLEGGLKDASTRAMKNGHDSFAQPEWAGSITALRNVGTGDRAAVAVARRISNVESPDAIAWPILAAAALGLAFVFIAGGILGGYITDPVGKMEESLLQVINGNTNHRVQIEHAELGGLAFRINQLLNTVLGVDEDNTDEEGRPSVPPAPGHFSDALSVDGGGGDAAQAAALAAEPEASYYGRLYREYIDAKRANGESVENITEQVFVDRIRGMERDQGAKMGRAVRYAVQRRDGQVRLLAIPL
ncbi:MAG: hypothetical protein HYV09_37140 [Deltaproteobacteria bacterium]|nr:hypothetical protein [Deltaproteobacteria bacterium]